MFHTGSITASTVSNSISSGTPAGAAGASASSVNFRQLQEQINKWTIDVEEQERDFIEQATKVNYWDKTLMSNAEKVCLRFNLLLTINYLLLFNIHKQLVYVNNKNRVSHGPRYRSLVTVWRR